MSAKPAKKPTMRFEIDWESLWDGRYEAACSLDGPCWGGSDLKELKATVRADHPDNRIVFTYTIAARRQRQKEVEQCS